MSIRLVPEERPEPLTVDEFRDTATDAYSKARAAQRALVGNLGLSELLHRPGTVSYYRLKGELSEALRQVERAQSVADSLRDALSAFEATR